MRKQSQKTTSSRRRATKEMASPFTGEVTDVGVSTQAAVEVLNSQDPEKWPLEAALHFEQDREQAAPLSNREMEQIEHRLVTLLAASRADIKNLEASCQRLDNKIEHVVNENKHLREELHDEIQSRVRETRKEFVAYVERKIHPLREDLTGKMEHNNATFKSSVTKDLKKQRNLMFLMFVLAMLVSASVFFLGQR